MITKDIDTQNIPKFGSCFFSDLANCPVMVQPAQASNVGRIDLGVVGKDFSIRVGWVRDNYAFDIRFSN
jgi:hypothetical protein